jgi:hypothetical protein
MLELLPNDNDNEEAILVQQSPIAVCPKCTLYSGLSRGEQSADERGDLVEGLVGITLFQCSNQDCLHEWEAVTHSQVLRSMRSWVPYTGFPGR